jgi:hypothetical protein
MIRCVYCKASKPRPKNGEHIILDGLGGTATIIDACGDCNHGFGKALDREFLRNSIIALNRLFDPAAISGEVPRPQFVPTEWGHLDARIANDRSLTIPPQVARLSANRFIIVCPGDGPPEEDLAKTLQSDIERIVVSVRDIPEYEPARVIFGRPGKTHLLRARRSEDADSLLADLRTGLPVATFALWKPDIERVRIRISFDVNVPGRCAAKMAFNMATAVLGSDVMLREDFDPVRAYIRGEDVLEGPAVGENGEVGCTIDYRFVDPWIDRPRAQGATDTRVHAITLEVAAGRLYAHVSLFGGLDYFRVRLGPLAEGVKESTMIFALSCRPDGDWWVPGEGLPWPHRKTLQR